MSADSSAACSDPHTPGRQADSAAPIPTRIVSSRTRNRAHRPLSVSSRASRPGGHDVASHGDRHHQVSRHHVGCRRAGHSAARGPADLAALGTQMLRAENHLSVVQHLHVVTFVSRRRHCTCQRCGGKGYQDANRIHRNGAPPTDRDIPEAQAVARPTLTGAGQRELAILPRRSADMRWCVATQMEVT